MRSKPFAKADKKKILAVCDVVRQHLGLGSISTWYEFKPYSGPKDKMTMAASFVLQSGWRCIIEFYDTLFRQPLHQQLETIVHEHIHVLFQPLDQVLNRMEGLLLKKDRDQFYENVHVAREIAVDRAAAPITALLMPYIQKVL